MKNTFVRQLFVKKSACNRICALVLGNTALIQSWLKCSDAIITSLHHFMPYLWNHHRLKDYPLFWLWLKMGQKHRMDWTRSLDPSQQLSSILHFQLSFSVHIVFFIFPTNSISFLNYQCLSFFQAYISISLIITNYLGIFCLIKWMNQLY